MMMSSPGPTATGTRAIAVIASAEFAPAEFTTRGSSCMRVVITRASPAAVISHRVTLAPIVRACAGSASESSIDVASRVGVARAVTSIAPAPTTRVEIATSTGASGLHDVCGGAARACRTASTSASGAGALD
jgi:hypothetical protein